MKTFSFLVVVVVVTLSAVNAVPFKDCGSTSGHINSININSCPRSPCELIRGTNVSVELDFTSYVDTTNVTSSVHGIILGVPLPFPGFQPDSCKGNNLACPVTANSNNIYTNYVNVLHEYPTISLLIQWELKDDHGNNLVCFVMPAQIVDHPSAVVG